MTSLTPSRNGAAVYAALSTRRCAAAALFFALGLAPGCVTETPDRSPRVLSGAGQRVPTPAHVREIANALIVDRSRQGRMPASLEDLAARGVLAPSSPLDYSAFAYQPGGLGVLPDGRTVLFVDSRIAQGEAAWCIVSQPIDGVRAAVIEAALVPMAQLDAAAQAPESQER
ncbi:MAG: hypothetical protein AAF288_04980 [Planctomycetota bacterium]